jgi:hypothetical protein
MKKAILILLAVAIAGIRGYAQAPSAIAPTDTSTSPATESPSSPTLPTPSEEAATGTIENQVEIDSMQEKVQEPQVEKITEKDFEKLWKSVKSRRYQVVDSLSIEDIVEPNTEYHYAAFSKPNPFVPPELDQTFDAQDLDGTEIPMVNALQNYPLGSLSLKGIWQLPTGQRRAIIMTPKKEGVIVQPGDPISVGKVESIEKDHIVARQFRMLTDGSRQFEDKKLYLGMAPTSTPGKIVVEPGKDPIYQQPSIGEDVIPTVDSPSTPASDGAVYDSKLTAPMPNEPVSAMAPTNVSAGSPAAAQPSGTVNVAPAGAATVAPTTSAVPGSAPTDAAKSVEPNPMNAAPKSPEGIPSLKTNVSKTRY